MISGEAYVDSASRELRFVFTFAGAVYPSTDFDHWENQLYGYVDIDLDVPPVTGQRVSKKSEFSGYLSGLDAEAIVNLGDITGSTAALLAPSGTPCAAVPVEFDQDQVTIHVPFSSIPGSRSPGDKIAYAAYFYSSDEMTADVFPDGALTEGQGYLVSPEPASASLMALSLGGWAARRLRRARVVHTKRIAAKREPM